MRYIDSMCRPCFGALLILVGTTGTATAEATDPAVSDLDVVIAPLTVQEGSGRTGTLVAEYDGTVYAELAMLRRVRLSRLSLAGDVEVDLILERFDVLLPGASVIRVDPEGAREVDAPAVVHFRGHVAGIDGSWAYLAASATDIFGIVAPTPGVEHVIAVDRARAQRGEPADHVVYERFTAFADAPPSPPFCQTPSGTPRPRPEIEPHGRGGPLRTAWLALDCDWEYRNLFASDIASRDYAVMLAGAMSAIYERDLNLRIYVSFLRTWNIPNDPWTEGTTEDQLDEFRDYWNDNEDHVCRTAAHLLSARDIGGGRAFEDQTCNSNAYGVNGSFHGQVPLPPPNPGPDNWDLVVLTHELGHNFGATHTHCYDPPVDTCAGDEYDCPDAQVCQTGTLMSYCHLCTGAMSNIQLAFHGVSIADMLGDLENSCLISAADPVYVSNLVTGCNQNGSSSLPFRRVDAGVASVFSEGTVYIRPGTYTERWTLGRPATLRVWPGMAGSVIIDP